MQQHVVIVDGPVGVGKTSLSRAAANQLDYAFIDGDDLSEPGYWLHSILRTSKRIVSAAEEQLKQHNGVVISYPLRCTNWVFYKGNFNKRGIEFHSIGLTADVSHIAQRARKLSKDELARSAQMSAEGYGQRKFSDAFLHTDQAGFEETSLELARLIAAMTNPTS